MRVAHINGCILCKDFRIATDLDSLMKRAQTTDEAPNVTDRGEAPSEEFYAAVLDWRQSEIFSPRERMAIEFAERVSLSPEELPYDDEFWTRMHATFDDGEIVDLTYSITTWIATGRFVHVLQLDGSCPTELASTAAS